MKNLLLLTAVLAFTVMSCDTADTPMQPQGSQGAILKQKAHPVHPTHPPGPSNSQDVGMDAVLTDCCGTTWHITATIHFVNGVPDYNYTIDLTGADGFSESGIGLPLPGFDAAREYLPANLNDPNNYVGELYPDPGPGTPPPNSYVMYHRLGSCGATILIHFHTITAPNGVISTVIDSVECMNTW